MPKNGWRSNQKNWPRSRLIEQSGGFESRLPSTNYGDVTTFIFCETRDFRCVSCEIGWQGRERSRQGVEIIQPGRHHDLGDVHAIAILKLYYECIALLF